MPLFARLAVFVLPRRLVPRLGEMLVAAAAPSAPRDEDTLARRGEVGEGFPGVVVEDQRAHGRLENHVRAGMACAIRAFAVASAFGAKFAVEAVAQERIVVRIGFEIHARAVAAVAARRAAAGHPFLPPEGHAAVAAVARLHQNFGFVNEHKEPSPSKGYDTSKSNATAGKNADRKKRRQAQARLYAWLRSVGCDGRCGLFGWQHADEAPVAALILEFDVARDECEERVVLAPSDVQTGLVLRAALADEYGARIDELAAEALDAQPLSVRIAAVRG